jgi:hypothetical protein
MPVHFWIWLFFAVWTLWGGLWGYRAAPAPTLAWGPPVIFWLLMLALCWAVAGNPSATLVR